MLPCLSPVDIKDPRYSYKKYMLVPCGKCVNCKLNYAKMWSIRIMHELKDWDSACFLTLTYDEEHLPKDGSLDKQDLQKFFKRLRFNLGGRKIKYFACGEYGEQYGRPHYHIIVFGLNGQTELDIIQKSWLFGFVGCGSVTIDSANYVARYTVKGGLTDEECYQRGIQPQFLVMSRRPGIGANLANCKDYQTWISNTGFCVSKGLKFPIPRYYKSKLSLELLDKLRKKIVDYISSKTFDNLDKHNKNYHKLLGTGHIDYVEPVVTEREIESQLWKNSCSRLSLKRGKL